MNRTPRNNSVVVVGCGRSGTLYTTRYFAKMGLLVGHEKWYSNGITSWYLCLDSQYNKFKQLKHKTSFKIFHQIRHPLKVISSFIPRKRFTEEIFHKIKSNEEESRLLQCMKYWYYWNKLTESLFKPDLRYKVENMNKDFVIKAITGVIGIKLTEIQITNIQKIPTDIHTANIANDVIHFDAMHKKYSKVYTWNELENEDVDIFNKIQTLAKEYGYN